VRGETGKSLQLDLDINLITMQCTPNDDFTIYGYMDFKRKKFETYINDEVKLKLNVEKLAKKRLNIKDFWEDVQDVKFHVDFTKSEFSVIYYTKD